MMSERQNGVIKGSLRNTFPFWLSWPDAAGTGGVHETSVLCMSRKEAFMLGVAGSGVEELAVLERGLPRVTHATAGR